MVDTKQQSVTELGTTVRTNEHCVEEDKAAVPLCELKHADQSTFDFYCSGRGPWRVKCLAYDDSDFQLFPVDHRFSSWAAVSAYLVAKASTSGVRDRPHPTSVIYKGTTIWDTDELDGDALPNIVKRTDDEWPKIVSM